MFTYNSESIKGLKQGRPADLATHLLDANPLRFHLHEQSLWYWNDTCWLPVDDRIFRETICRMMKAVGNGWVKKRYVEDVYYVLTSLVGSEPSYATQPHLPDGHYATLQDAVGNVLVSSRCEPYSACLTIHPPNPRLFCPYRVPYSFDPEARCPQFVRMLDDLLDSEQITTLLTFFASCLVHRRVFNPKISLILLGKGSNGKSTVAEIMAAVLGLDNVRYKPLGSLFLAKERVDIANTLAIIVDDAPQYVSETAELKTLIAGEPIEVRRLYHAPATITSYGRIVLTTNHLPKFSDTSEGMYRRMQVIEFTRSIPAQRRDTTLATRIIKSESPGIFNLLLEHTDWVQRVEIQTKETEALLYGLREENDSVFAFWQTKSDGSSGLVDPLYNEYKSFCAAAGVQPVSRHNMVSRLTRAGAIKRRTADGYVIHKPVQPSI